MKRNHRIHSTPWQTFRDYLKGKSSNRTQHVFEKRLMVDDFEAEALEGFSLLDTTDIDADLKLLQQQLNSRVKKKRGMPFYLKIAASFVVLITSSLMIWFVYTPPVDFISDNGVKIKENISTVSEVPRAGRFIDSSQQPEEEKVVLAEKVLEEITDTRSNNKKIFAKRLLKKETEKAIEVAEVPDQKESKSVIVASAFELGNEAVAKVVDVGMAKKENLSPLVVDSIVSIRPLPESVIARVTGRVLDEEGFPLPGVAVVQKGTGNGTLTDMDGQFLLEPVGKGDSSIRLTFIGMEPVDVNFASSGGEVGDVALKSDVLAMDEVVVVGYGSAKRLSARRLFSSNKEKRKEGAEKTLKPEPDIGWDAFYRFVQEHLVYPDKFREDAKREVVVLSLKITANGTVAAIKVVKSSNKVFSDEAIRIVKEASGWVAGRIGENRIADSVKVRIVFKPKK